MKVDKAGWYYEMNGRMILIKHRDKVWLIAQFSKVKDWPAVKERMNWAVL